MKIFKVRVLPLGALAPSLQENFLVASKYKEAARKAIVDSNPVIYKNSTFFIKESTEKFCGTWRTNEIRRV
jgi:hypothetical protein